MEFEVVEVQVSPGVFTDIWNGRYTCLIIYEPDIDFFIKMFSKVNHYRPKCCTTGAGYAKNYTIVGNSHHLNPCIFQCTTGDSESCPWLSYFECNGS